MRMLEDKILVKVEPAATQTASGFFLPETARSETEATVVAAGPDSGVTEGDVLFVQPKAGVPVKIDGVEHKVITSKQVLVVL